MKVISSSIFCCLVLSELEKDAVIIHFMCQLDCTMFCPDIWLNIIKGGFVRVFLHEINIWIYTLRKADGPPRCGWSSSTSLEARAEQKHGGRENSLSLLTVFDLRQWFSPNFGFGLELEFMSSALLVFKPCNWDYNYIIGLLGLQLADCRS